MTDHSEETNLFMIFSLPKSAGQALRMMLNSCMTKSQERLLPPSADAPNGLHVDLQIVERMIRDFPDGGWYHSHAAASFVTLDTLHAHGIRHIILFRHPLDQLVAYYCHIRKHVKLGFTKPIPWKRDYVYAVPMAWTRLDVFGDRCAPADALQHLIADGYLEATLRWICEWCEFGKTSLSEVLRYEDLIREPLERLKALVDFLAPMLDGDENRLAAAVDHLTKYRSTSLGGDGEHGGRSYPLGYSGKVGVYREYFSKQNLETAGRIIQRFCSSTPYSSHLLSYYPELTDLEAIRHDAQRVKVGYRLNPILQKILAVVGAK